MDLQAFAREADCELVTDPERLRPYEVPERGEPGHAAGLLRPERSEQIGAILRAASRHQVPLVIAAGRTGLVEAQRPDGEVVLALDRLRRALSFQAGDFAFRFPADGDPTRMARALFAAYESAGRPALEDARLVVQAGMPIDAVNEILAPLGLCWPLEMGSSASASVGACVANASAGANAIAYGTAAHLCESAVGFYADGSPAGPFSGPRWTGADPQRVLIDSARIDPRLGLIGTQGIFGVITELTLRLVPVPAQREGLLLPLAELSAAVRVLEAARARGLRIEEYEFMSRHAVALVAELRGESFRFPLPRRDAPAFVLLQLASADPDEDLLGPLYALASEDLGLPGEAIGYAPLPELKAIRHAITEASNAAMRARGGGRLSFDTAVPPARLGAYLAELDAALDAIGDGLLRVAFGHAGVGGLHLHVLGNPELPVAACADRIVQTVFDVTAAHGGTFSAEHGVGPKWAQEFRHRVPAELVATLRGVKRRHDPAGILNPRSFGLLDS